MLAATLTALWVDGNQFVQPFSDILQPIMTCDPETGSQSFLGDDPYGGESGRRTPSSAHATTPTVVAKSTRVYEPWRRSAAPKRMPTLTKRRSHGDLMTIIGLQKKDEYSNSTDDLAADLQKASTMSAASGAYIAASFGEAGNGGGRRERSVSTSNTPSTPSEFHTDIAVPTPSNHPLSLNKFLKSIRKSSRSSLKDTASNAAMASKKRLSVGSELDPTEDGHLSESAYVSMAQVEAQEQENSSNISSKVGTQFPSKRTTSGGGLINQWVRDRFHKRTNSNELVSLPSAQGSSTSILLDAQQHQQLDISESHPVRDSGYGGSGATTHSPDLSGSSPTMGLGVRMNKSTSHLPYVPARDSHLSSSFDPLQKKERDYRFSYMSMESSVTQGTENDVDSQDITNGLPMSLAQQQQQHRLSSLNSPTTPLPSSPVMLSTSSSSAAVATGAMAIWNAAQGPKYGQSAAQIKPIMHYLKDLHDLDPDSSEWEEVYAWRRVWNAERSTTTGMTANGENGDSEIAGQTGGDDENENEEKDAREKKAAAKAEEIRLAKLQAQATRRRKIMAEIIGTERTYVEGLKGLVEIYLTPAHQIMSPGDHKAVFSNAQALYTFHADHFLPELEKAYAATKVSVSTSSTSAVTSPMSPMPSSSPFLSDPSAPSSAASSTAALGVHHQGSSVGQSSDISTMSSQKDSRAEGNNDGVVQSTDASAAAATATAATATATVEAECRIGRVFAEHVAYMKMYSFYVNNYDNALRVMQTQLTSKHKKKTKEYIRRCAKHPNHTQLGLQGYLLLPVQRIPRYKMLLEDLLENTWPDHVDYQDIATALEKISSRADEMNERKRQYENHEKVLLVQNRIVGQYRTPLVQPHRKVVREGMLHLIRIVTRNVSMSERSTNMMPAGQQQQQQQQQQPQQQQQQQTLPQDLTVHHLSEETVERPFLFILFNDIMIQCQPCDTKATLSSSGTASSLTGAGAGATGAMGGIVGGNGSSSNGAGAGGVVAGGGGGNAASSSMSNADAQGKNLELCRVLQLESRLHPAEVIGTDVLRVVDDAVVMYLTGDKDVVQAWKEDINSRW
ncbi:hypothetical protein BG004_006864 [Podila humilis]|nr:hypothetical protein BG004_006864 [Podila humilis]